VFYVIDTGSTGSGGAPGDCLCIPSAFTLTLAMLVTLSGRRFCCPSQPRRGPGGLMSCGALWEGRPYSTRERADKARDSARVQDVEHGLHGNWGLEQANCPTQR